MNPPLLYRKKKKKEKKGEKREVREKRENMTNLSLHAVPSEEEANFFLFIQ